MSFNEKTFSYYKKFKKIVANPTRKIFLLYLLIFLIGSFLLWLPISLNQPHKGEVSFLDAMFTSASAFSDTGLTTLPPTYQVFNFFGQLVIFILIITGGLGLYTLKVFILSFFIDKFSYRNYDLVSSEMSSKNKISTIGMVRTSFFVSIFSILFFGFILALMFVFLSPSTQDYQVQVNNPQGNFSLSLWMGIFTAASALNNAGFDITSSSSLAPYATNEGLQFIVMILFILGGIGFPLIYEIIEKSKAKLHGKKYKMSLTSKILIVSYLSIAFAGLGMVYMIEGLSTINNPNAFLIAPNIDLTTPERVWALTFNTFSTRSAGFSTIDLNLLNNGTLIIYIMMMFIGAGTSSTTGGIRTTTMWIILLYMFKTFSGKDDVNTFKRRIKKERVTQSFSIFFFSIWLIFIATLIISVSTSINSNTYYLEPHIFEIIFTVTSAFGAVGLSVGQISSLGAISKMTLIIMMFIGQLGVGTTIKQFKSSNIKNVFRYPEEDILIG